jgi:hypothetical protein
VARHSLVVDVGPVGAVKVDDYQLIAGHLDPRVPPGDAVIIKDNRR